MKKYFPMFLTKSEEGVLLPIALVTKSSLSLKGIAKKCFLPTFFVLLQQLTLRSIHSCSAPASFLLGPLLP